MVDGRWTMEMEEQQPQSTTTVGDNKAQTANKMEASRKRSRSEESKMSALYDPNMLPPELAAIDFTSRIAWDKFQPYSDTKVLVVPLDEPPTFTDNSPALCHHIHAVSGRARACTIHLRPQPGQQQKPTPLPTPIFMPVGTKGCLKGLSMQELTSDPALACPIILANTYHMAIQPGTELVEEMGGLHSFKGLDKVDNEYSYNLLTDSGGFQMVSLVKLSNITEEGVSFENPFKKNTADQANADEKVDMLLLRPEDSIRHQNNISANIIMALDDVISSVTVDDARFQMATLRTLRWYDRCYEAHAKPDTQNLFPIVQGGLDTQLGGLREQCLAGFRHRNQVLGYQIPGYAIGGLAGGEEKDQFWRVVDQCCRALPDDKPRYLMGVGYPLDLVVCTALGVDMYDCVYPTRTARFGVALVPGASPGTLRLRGHEYAADSCVIQPGCGCQACRTGISRARLQTLLKVGNPLAAELITQHNIAYMMALVRGMRQAVLDDRYAEYASEFIKEQFPGTGEGAGDVPSWVLDALSAAGIDIPTTATLSRG
jgi:queuine tRNA-ribosyltransferase